MDAGKSKPGIRRLPVRMSVEDTHPDVDDSKAHVPRDRRPSAPNPWRELWTNPGREPQPQSLPESETDIYDRRR